MEMVYLPFWDTIIRKMLSWSKPSVSIVIMVSIIHGVQGDHSVYDLIWIQIKQIMIDIIGHAVYKRRIKVPLA